MRSLSFVLLAVSVLLPLSSPAKKSEKFFQPPDESKITDDKFGETVRAGRDIFMETQQYAKPYVGNALNCVNCHLNAGRLANSAPMWGAYVLYPAYRKKTKKVDTLESRIQGCFMYSMNGKAPPADSELMKDLVTYMYWMAHGAPTGVALPGQGYPALKKPVREPSWEAGAKVFEKNCALCHGTKGEGQFVDDKTVFPPLWGAKSFNWGAGMHRIDTAAGFIKANMPLGRGGSLTDQEAWDVAYFIDSHERPKDPRQKGGVEEARRELHQENCSYGKEIQGKLLGQGD